MADGLIATGAEIAATAPRRPRRVLMVNRVGFLGGVERILLTLGAGPAAQGWEALLACPAVGGLAEAAGAQGIRVVACPFDRMRITADPRVLARYPAAWMRCAAALEAACRAERIDLLHAHHPVSALYAMRAARRLRIPMLLHVHETLPARPLYAAAMRVALRGASGVVCVSAAARDLALALGADPARCAVVPNGVDARFFAAEPPAPAAEVLLAGPGPHVGLFAVLEPRKAQHVLLEAAAMLAGRFPTARFWIVGAAALQDKRDYADRLRRMAEAELLRGRVVMTGFRPDMPAWLAAMDVVVQTSVALESFGMALAEAQALGRPVVASRVGGMPEVVIEDETGLIVPPADAPALAAALVRLLGDPALRERLGRKGEAAARRRFAPEVFRAQVAARYDALLHA
ncbi:glycosyltransferase family 4 protein [Falsiroseomonas oryziterrae]|uniref:glycosyltransferase family 4 protein n=1 Tax=Falsiroseomonas oryziterrae TaxID=2911368 RepID=UPI001F262D2B|nr:glycosyltransferase family 4 protein [Roseomonas sp. NPKOSM-4]